MVLQVVCGCAVILAREAPSVETARDSFTVGRGAERDRFGRALLPDVLEPGERPRTTAAQGPADPRAGQEAAQCRHSLATTGELSWKSRDAPSTLAIQKRERLRVDIPPGILSEPAGAFVTLQRHKRLRGCIGRLAPSEPLAQVVADSAMSAALEDPRFEPLRPEEVAEVEIEISVLSKFAADRTRRRFSRARTDLVIQRGNRRGLLLPQVATEYKWTPGKISRGNMRKGGTSAGCVAGRRDEDFADSPRKFFQKKIFGKKKRRGGDIRAAKIELDNGGYSSST